VKSFVTSLAAVVLAAACAACGNADGATNANAGQGGSLAASTVASAAPDVPETLSAATAAAQANVDLFSSGDFAGVWERMSQQVRDGITQEDFVTFYETCKTTGPRIRVAGMLLDAANGQAIVRAKVGSVERSRTMLFEDGKWVMKPTQEFAAHLGEPVQKIIAEETAVGLCAK
jgi:hypothetical protein